MDPTQADHVSSPLQTLRDNFTIQTWLCIGALIQGALCFLPYRNIALVAPVFLYLAYQVTRTTLMCFGLLKNPYMDGVNVGRTVPIFPSEKGVQDQPGEKEICAIILAARSNHPLGMFAPGYKETGDFMNRMHADLNANPTINGFLGASSWISSCDRGVSGETMLIAYFESSQALHDYAHGPLHTETMEWWQKQVKNLPHIGIMHEIYTAPKNNWEGVYVNYHPTGLSAATIETERDGKKVWVNPLVKGNGRLTYSKGRMGKVFSPETEWKAYDDALTAEEKV